MRSSHLADGLLPGQLAAPVGAGGTDRILLAVRGAGLTGEHVIGGIVNQHRSHGGRGFRQHPRGLAIEAMGLLGFLLSPVHRGVGGRIHHEGGP